VQARIPLSKTQKTSKIKYLVLFAIIVLTCLGINYNLNQSAKKAQQAALLSAVKSNANLGAFPIKVPKIKYGFALDTFHVTVDTIKNNQILAEILAPHKVDYQNIHQLALNVQDTFSVTKLRAFKEYTILSRDTAKGADFFIYEIDVYSYVVYDLKDKLDARVVHRPVETTIKEAAGAINSSLWVTMQENGYPIDLIDKMEGVLQWSLDFYHIQNGDKFKLIYEEKTVDGKYAGIGKVLAAYFKNYDTDYYGIYYETGKFKGY